MSWVDAMFKLNTLSFEKYKSLVAKDVSANTVSVNIPYCRRVTYKQRFIPGSGGVVSGTQIIDRTDGCIAVGYNKLTTGGNDPHITKAMRYSQYVKTTRHSMPVLPYK